MLAAGLQTNGMNGPDLTTSNNERSFSIREFMKMNRLLNLKSNLLLALMTGLLVAQARAETVRYNAQPKDSIATVAGDSSIHAWTMESGVIGGFMEVDVNFPESALTNAAAAKPVTSVYVPVRSLKSGKATMDEKMQNTMSMTNYPKFEYRLIELKPKSQPGATGPLQFDAIGTLTIVGKTITNTMPVTIEKKDGKLKIQGSTPIKLTQFSIKPPIIALPLLPDITVYDDLKIDFTWTLAPKAEKK